MLPEKIRQRQRAELAAIHRLEAAGYTVEGWSHTTSLLHRCPSGRLEHEPRQERILELSDMAGCRLRSSGLTARGYSARVAPYKAAQAQPRRGITKRTQEVLPL